MGLQDLLKPRLPPRPGKKEAMMLDFILKNYTKLAKPVRVVVPNYFASQRWMLWGELLDLSLEVIVEEYKVPWHKYRI